MMMKPLSNTATDEFQQSGSSVQEVVEMICRPLVEPDIVQKIFHTMSPMDVMNLELALPGLANHFLLYNIFPLIETNGDVRFDFVRWKGNVQSPFEEVLENCEMDDDGAFVRVRLDGSHVTAYDVSDRWIALGYYSGAIRLFDRKHLSFSKLVYDEKKNIDRYSGKISHIWVHDDTVITMDTRNNLVMRTVSDLDEAVKHILGDTLVQLVVQKDVCLQLFENEESFNLVVFEVAGKNLVLIKQLSIPKIVTSNIIRVSLDTTNNLLLMYYEEEMLDYRTWKNIELFGGQLSLHFQEFYAAFTGRRLYSSDRGSRTQFLVLLQYETGSVLDQYQINPNNPVLGVQSSLRVLTKVGEGMEENLWKVLKPSIDRAPLALAFNQFACSIPNQILYNCDTYFTLRKVPNRLLQNVLIAPPKEKELFESYEQNGQRTIKCKLVSKNVYYDERSLIYHIEADGRSEVIILDLWKGDWEPESLHKIFEWRKIPDLVESSTDGDTEVSDESDTDSNDSILVLDAQNNNAFVEDDANVLYDIGDLEDDAILVKNNDEELGGNGAGLENVSEGDEIGNQNEESEDEMPSLETGTGL